MCGSGLVGSRSARIPEKHGGIDAPGQQKCMIVPKVEADSEIINEGYPARPTPPKESPVLTHPSVEEREERRQASPGDSFSENEENGDSDSPSTSDSAWSPRHSSPRDVRRNSKRAAASSDSDTDDEDEDEDEDGVEDELVLNEADRRGKRLFSQVSNSVDKTKNKRGRLSDMDAGEQTDCPNDEDGVNGTKSPLLVEGYLVKKHGHDWHVAGTKRGRTYVSKRRPVTKAEKQNTLERARQVHINKPSFLNQLHKDSYRSLKLAQRLQKQNKQKHKQKDASSSNPKNDTEVTDFYRSKKNPEITEIYKRSVSQGRGKALQNDKPAPDSPCAFTNEVEPLTIWKRPTTRISSREISQNSGELLTRRVNLKQELEEVLGGD